MKSSKKDTTTGFSRYLRYRRGEMQGKEMNAFEKDIQRDPFAAEAEEGLSSENEETLEKDINRLRQMILRRTRKRNRFMIYRIAASVAVLMIISSVFLVVQKGGKTEPVLSSAAGELKPVEIVRDKPLKIDKATDEVKSRPADEIKSSGSNISQVSDDDAVSSENTEQKKPTEVIESGRERSLVARKQLAGEDVHKDGDEKESERGRMEEDLAASTDTRKNDMMEPSAAIAEVAAYGEKKSEKVKDSTGYIPAVPVTGMDTFNKYLKENINRPDSSTAGQRVVVVISFSVLPGGEIDSIRVIRSQGEEFSREAIRLIKSGPAWKPAMSDGKPVRDEVRMRIVFE